MVKTVKSFLPEKSDSVFLDSYCGSGFFSLFARFHRRNVHIWLNKKWLSSLRGRYVTILTESSVMIRLKSMCVRRLKSVW